MRLCVRKYPPRDGKDEAGDMSFVLLRELLRDKDGMSMAVDIVDTDL